MPVRVAWEGRLARITLDRPPLNVLDVDHLRELARAVEEAEKAAVLCIDGGEARAFSAGNDLRDHAPERAPAMLEAFHDAVRGLLLSDAVVVADVRGDALGGGAELLACCDLVYASADARIGQPEIDVGCFPPVAASILPRRIGWARAAELILLGRTIDAETARQWGLVTAIGPARPAIDALLAKSAPVLRLAKAAMRDGSLGAAERRYLDELLPLPDCAEGVRAFLEKRKPRWS